MQVFRRRNQHLTLCPEKRIETIYHFCTCREKQLTFLWNHAILYTKETCRMYSILRLPAWSDIIHQKKEWGFLFSGSEPNLLTADGSLFLWPHMYPDRKRKSKDTAQITKKAENHVSPSFRLKIYRGQNTQILRYFAPCERECATPTTAQIILTRCIHWYRFHAAVYHMWCDLSSFQVRL